MLLEVADVVHRVDILDDVLSILATGETDGQPLWLLHEAEPVREGEIEDG